MILEFVYSSAGLAARAFEPVCLHFAFTIIFATSIILWVDRLTVNDGDTRRADGRTLWTVSDVTTLVSSGLVIIRWTTNAWTIQTGWRYAMILMRELPAGLKATDLEHVTSASLLVLSDWWIPWKWLADYRKDLIERRDRTLAGQLAFTTAVFWLLIPATVLAPLLSGAINWQSKIVLVDAGHVTPIYGGPAGLNPGSGNAATWFSYVQALTVEGAIAKQRPTLNAAGFASSWKNTPTLGTHLAARTACSSAP